MKPKLNNETIVETCHRAADRVLAHHWKLWFWADGIGLGRFGKLNLISEHGIEIVDNVIAISNGLGLSPINATLYYTDSGTRETYAYNMDATSGRRGNKRTLVEAPHEVETLL